MPSATFLVFCAFAVALVTCAAPVDTHCFHGAPCTEWEDDDDGFVDISGLDLHVLVHELWKQQVPVVTRGFDPTEVEAILASKHKYFYYISGRAMKFTADGRRVDPSHYDEQAGEGTMARIVAALRAVDK
jgi:hypothetical protein